MKMVKQPLKILMTADTVGGVWTYCMELCSALEQHDVQVHLVTMGARMSDWQKKQVQQLGHVVVHETDFLLEWMHKPWTDVKDCGAWLLRLEEEIQPDIIHLNCFAYGCMPFKAPVMVVAHSDVYSWYLSVKQDDPPASWKEYFWCVKNGLKDAGLVVAPSQWMLDTVKKIYSVDTECRVVYNGRSAELFTPARKQQSVFGMGRLWDEGKNIRLLADAAPMIDAPVSIAGDESFDRNSFAVPGGVDFLGKLSAALVARQLSTAAVYALPARYEPFGLSPLEAALSGCALVLGDIPSLREIWSDAAIYVNTHDARALANAVNELLNDSEKLEHFRSQAGMRAKLFTTEAMCNEYMDIYQQLVREKELYLKREAV